MNAGIARGGMLAAAVLMIGSTVYAQGPPKPTAEHQKLAYFVGEWKGEGELKANPFMPAGKYTTDDDCEWFQGNFAVVCKSEGKGPSGEMKSVFIMGYNAEEKAYTYYGVDSNGMVPATVALGKVTGDTWTFHEESKFGGQLVKSRYTVTQVSPKSFSFLWEVQGPDGKWMALMDGKNTKSGE